jgi:transcriptional regulator with XRE-family HTH domain
MSHPQYVPEPTGEHRTNAPCFIGKRLRALTIALHLTPDEVADLAAVPQRHVHEWLAGVRIPSCRQISRLVREASISLAWIYYGDEHGLPLQQLAILREALTHDTDIQARRSGSCLSLAHTGAATKVASDVDQAT